MIPPVLTIQFYLIDLVLTHRLRKYEQFVLYTGFNLYLTLKTGEGCFWNCIRRKTAFGTNMVG